MREYSPYVITQLRGCLSAARHHKEAQFDCWEEIGKVTRRFHKPNSRIPFFFDHEQERGPDTRYGRSLVFSAVMRVSDKRCRGHMLGAMWPSFEAFAEDIKAYLMPQIEPIGEARRWDGNAVPNRHDDGNSCLYVLRGLFDSGDVKLILAYKKIEALRYQSIMDLKGELKKIGLTREAVKAVTNKLTLVSHVSKIGIVPDTDQGMIDFYWEAMLKAGLENRMTLHKAMLDYMTQNFLKSSKVSLGNWLDYKGYRL